jgi:hypothetical protein
LAGLAHPLQWQYSQSGIRESGNSQSDQARLSGIPAMLMFKDGREIHRVIGFDGKKQLVAELEPDLA